VIGHLSHPKPAEIYKLRIGVAMVMSVLVVLMLSMVVTVNGVIAEDGNQVLLP
jgi:hypothetical protein